MPPSIPWFLSHCPSPRGLLGLTTSVALTELAMSCPKSTSSCPTAAQSGRLHGLAAAALAALSVSLQGCTLDIPRHDVGNWQQKPSYLNTYGFSAPGSSETTLNSCASTSVQNLQCNGHGRCVDWFENNTLSALNGATPLTFCECDEYWAGPECSTQRKSQLTAFMLSLFFGIFGADQFYLGFWWPQGLIKLFTLGGCGFWWLYDLVRIGSSPVPTVDNFRVAANVEHWAFVLIIISFFFFIGFALSIWSMRSHRLAKAREIMTLRADQSVGYGSQGTANFANRGPPLTSPAFRGYATTLQA